MGKKGNGGYNESVSGQIGFVVMSLSDPFHQDQLIYSETQTTQVGITINYSAPVFITTSSSTAIEENSEVGQVVYFGSAADISPIMFSITANNEDANSLSINSGTGEVTLAIRPDYVTKSAYSFTLIATDAAGNSSEKMLFCRLATLICPP